MKVSEYLILFIIAYEQIHDGSLKMIGLQPKLDACGIWTEGYGHAMIINGKFARVEQYPTLESILPHQTIHNIEDAKKVLRIDIIKFESTVNRNLTRKVTQNQFDALVSFCFNCGFSKNLFKLVNQNTNQIAIKNFWINNYIKGNGKILLGLQYRRVDECEMYFNGDYKRDYKLSINLAA